jgi:MFS family permease
MSQATATQTDAPPSVTPALAFLLALACGLIVANLYYAQPLTGLIGTSLQLAPATTGLLVTMTQLGYGLGLLAFVPLGDLIDNRRLAVTSVLIAGARRCKSCCRSPRILPPTRTAGG